MGGGASKQTRREFVSFVAFWLKGGPVESELYEPIRHWLQSPEFAPTQGDRQFLRETRAIISAEMSWLDQSANWLHPDISLVHVSRRKYDPFPRLDLHCVEVKPETQNLTSGLHQALSYSRIADFCYLAAPISAGWTNQIEELGERFGVGLISFANEKDWSTYSLRQGQRMSPDSDLRDLFLSSLLQDVQDDAAILNALGARP